MPIAFKEWAVTVRALAEGEQLLTLRKGGIREPDKHFSLEHDRFFLYPTFDHQRNDLVRESHHPELRRALEEGRWQWEGAQVRVDGELLAEGEFLVEREAENEGFAFASDGELSVEIDPVLDDDLRLEGRLFDLTHAVNVLRKERGLEVSDRIRLELPAGDADLLELYRGRIAEETLAVEIEVGEAIDLVKADN